MYHTSGGWLLYSSELRKLQSFEKLADSRAQGIAAQQVIIKAQEAIIADLVRVQAGLCDKLTVLERQESPVTRDSLIVSRLIRMHQCKKVWYEMSYNDRHWIIMLGMAGDRVPTTYVTDPDIAVVTREAEGEMLKMEKD